MGFFLFCFGVGFFSEWKRRGFSFLDMFFFLQVRWYDSFLLPRVLGFWFLLIFCWVLVLVGVFCFLGCFFFFCV